MDSLQNIIYEAREKLQNNMCNIWRKEWQPTPVCLLENSLDRGAWQAMVHGVT